MRERPLGAPPLSARRRLLVGRDAADAAGAGRPMLRPCAPSCALGVLDAVSAAPGCAQSYADVLAVPLAAGDSAPAGDSGPAGDGAALPAAGKRGMPLGEGGMPVGDDGMPLPGRRPADALCAEAACCASAAARAAAAAALARFSVASRSSFSRAARSARSLAMRAASA